MNSAATTLTNRLNTAISARRSKHRDKYQQWDQDELQRRQERTSKVT